MKKIYVLKTAAITPQTLVSHVHERLERSHRTEARLVWGGGPGYSRRPAGRRVGVVCK